MSSHTRLFVGNVSKSVNENDLQEAFSSYGQIINVDLKSKSNAETDQNKFAFITISGSLYEIESCIKHFSSQDFGGSRLYVSRARESFLERLQRERSETQKKEAEKNDPKGQRPKKNPVLKLGDKLNPRKRKIEHQIDIQAKDDNNILEVIKPYYEKKVKPTTNFQHRDRSENNVNVLVNNKKKSDSEQKRLESLKKKRQEFKEKQMIIKTGLVSVDKAPNKKIIFSDNEEDTKRKTINGFQNDSSSKSNSKKNNLFENEESDNEVNFEIKKQYEGKKGQKVLDLQSRYKSDKRFVLDERFIEDSESEDDTKEERADDERIDLQEADEKTKQLNILQDVLGVAIKTKPMESDSRKTKSKLGMLRFDPSQPEHAKFLAPVNNSTENNKIDTKKSKKKKNDKQEANKEEPEAEKVQVSKEQFYKVSETLKNALEQPSGFSLRSLFGQSEDNNEEIPEQDTNFISLTKVKDSKKKNPLDLSGKSPFVYDSSESEDEDPDIEVTKMETDVLQPVETKTVWKENLFFSKLDNRLQEGLAFFNKLDGKDGSKERRELKSVMKKRIYNKERKSQMFQKKIGGRKKTMKKSYRIKS